MNEDLKFDESPEDKFVDSLSKSFLDSTLSDMPMDKWLKDQPDTFYKGMLASLRICLSGVINMMETGAPAEALYHELMILQGQTCVVAKEKQSKIILV